MRNRNVNLLLGILVSYLLSFVTILVFMDRCEVEPVVEVPIPAAKLDLNISLTQEMVRPTAAHPDAGPGLGRDSEGRTCQQVVFQQCKDELRKRRQKGRPYPAIQVAPTDQQLCQALTEKYCKTAKLRSRPELVLI